MITCLVGKTPRLIDKTIRLLFLFDKDTLGNGEEATEFFLLSIVISPVYLQFVNIPYFL
ncbi:hypothetical protein SSYM_0845 [Serratia symbiotica str. Tucson]|uniref:Uncharacterized protein n=2 Tax=Serratia symbiotica TaxID=138074 RepID=E9CKY7_9GAMM|nr:hypothetical protein SSYM_0845 [Serratia symbiotica str. Tucson]BBI91867.1 uncharacterized protein SSYIS1_12960 [Serratia symbiotica]